MQYRSGELTRGLATLDEDPTGEKPVGVVMGSKHGEQRDARWPSTDPSNCGADDPLSVIHMADSNSGRLLAQAVTLPGERSSARADQ
jgi:hypothetical protein